MRKKTANWHFANRRKTEHTEDAQGGKRQGRAHENGGGEIHLIDISEEFLQDVFGKILQKGWKVTTHKHHIKINKARDS